MDAEITKAKVGGGVVCLIHSVRGSGRSCFNSSWQLSTTQPLLTLPQWGGTENKKGKSEKMCELR